MEVQKTVLKSTSHSFVSFFSIHTCTEWEEGKPHELEKLNAVGDADDGNTIDNARDKIAHRKPPARDHRPHDVGKGVCAEVEPHALAVGEQRKPCKLEALNAEGDTDDRDAKDKSHDRPCKREPHAA